MSKSILWKRILANVLDITLECPKTEQGPGMGAAMLAMVACGEYCSVSEVFDKLVPVSSFVQPEPILVEKYDTRYQCFQKIYPTCKNLFKELADHYI